jgi:hypothetical protein
MKIVSKIAFNEYLKLMYLLTYRKRISIYATILGLGMFATIIFSPTRATNELSSLMMPIIIGTIALVVLPTSVYFSAKKNYDSDAYLQETIHYEMTDERISIYGQSFNSELLWDKLYMVHELNNWLLIYHNKQVATIIPKNSISNILELREIIRNKGIKAKLKKK